MSYIRNNSKQDGGGRAIFLATALGLTLSLAGSAAAQTLSGVEDLIFADGFELPGPNCFGVAPVSNPRQIGGFWYLGTISQGNADFTNILTTQSNPGTPWPGTQSGTGRTYMIGTTNYVAMQFNTGDEPVGSIGNYQVSQSFFSPSPAYLTISQCQGDFRTAVLDDKCEMPLSGKGTLFWTVGQPSGFRCRLEQNTTYYLNIIMADPSNLAASVCSSSLCGILIFPGH